MTHPETCGGYLLIDYRTAPKAYAQAHQWLPMVWVLSSDLPPCDDEGSSLI